MGFDNDLCSSADLLISETPRAYLVWSIFFWNTVMNSYSQIGSWIKDVDSVRIRERKKYIYKESGTNVFIVLGLNHVLVDCLILLLVLNKEKY